MIDVAVIGAGMAGLVCAQQLKQAGYSVLVVEKSRGLGGRVATRRLHDIWADHGACYLKPKGEFFQNFYLLITSIFRLVALRSQVFFFRICYTFTSIICFLEYIN